MRARKYTIVIADRSNGVVRHVTVSLRRTLVGIMTVLALPVLMGLGAKWSAHAVIGQLQTTNSILQVENGSYRAATGELTAQIQSLETVINDLGTRATLDPAQVEAMRKLPAVVKARAAGGTVAGNAGPSNPAVTEFAKAAFSSPEDT
jgi:TolA-binding protein